MKIVSIEIDGKQVNGVIESDAIIEIKGSIFGTFEKTSNSYKIEDVKILPPVMPSKVVCIGQNYLEHIKEIGSTPPKVPLFFLKPPSSVIGTGESIVIPKMATRVDYEGELAIILKKDMKDVSEDEAMEGVLGYSCFNDVTERDMVGQDPFNLTISKSFDTFSSFGPCIETEVDGNNLDIKTYLNGTVMQDDNTNSCVFNIQKLISYLSQCMTLCQGDVITTGTPKGIAPMKPGDLVEVEIEGIGKLSNKVTA